VLNYIGKNDDNNLCVDGSNLESLSTRISNEGGSAASQDVRNGKNSSEAGSTTRRRKLSSGEDTTSTVRSDSGDSSCDSSEILPVDQIIKVIPSFLPDPVNTS